MRWFGRAGAAPAEAQPARRAHGTSNFTWRAPLVLGGALVFWGAMVDLIAFAIPLAVLAELPAVVRWRWQLDRRDFDRVCDLTAVLLVLLVLYQFDRIGVGGIYGSLAWAPLALAPLLLAQCYSTRDSVSFASLFHSVRIAERRGRMPDPGALDVRLPFFVLCLLAGATLGGPGVGAVELVRSLYLPGCIVLLLAALHAHRPRRVHRASWLVAALIVGAGGWLGAEGVIATQRAIQPMVMDFMAQHVRRWRDPFSGHISLGDLRTMKGSERIVLRVQPPLGLPPPRRLREASYQSFSRAVWLSRSRAYSEVPPEGDGERWTLHDSAERPETVRISMALQRGRGLLPVPPGTEQLANLPVEQLYRTELDVLKVERGPGILAFDSQYDRDGGYGKPGGEDDLVVPRTLEDVVARYVDSLGIADASPREAADALLAFFGQSFSYSLEGLAGRREVRRLSSPLTTFLDEARAGHCELFATATVMLLRGAGVPARYVVGYAVDEWSELEQAYVVRRRHAHAWAEMWNGERWVVVDTTPPTWFAADAADPPWWRTPGDWLSYAWFEFMRWRWLAERSTWLDSLPWLVPPLLALLAWRLARRRRTRDLAPAVRAPLTPQFGADSEFYAVLDALAARSGAPREEGETVTAWLARLQALAPDDDGPARALALLPSHQRLRFDPRGLAPEVRRSLASESARWLARFAPGAPKAS